IQIMVQALQTNQSNFSSAFIHKKNTLRTRCAILQEMYVPSSEVEITYDEMEYIDGGGTWSLTLTSNVIGSAIGAVAGVFIKRGFTVDADAYNVNWESRRTQNTCYQG